MAYSQCIALGPGRTGNGCDTIGNNGSWSLSLFQTSVNISASYIRTHDTGTGLVPCPVPSPGPVQYKYTLNYLPCKAATRRGRGMALVVPSPNCPSSLSPQVYTSPVNMVSGRLRWVTSTKFPSTKVNVWLTYKVQCTNEWNMQWLTWEFT